MKAKYLKNKNVAVLGLGMEGKDLVRFLIKSEANVTLFDKKPQRSLDFSGINKGNLKLVLGKGYLSKGLKNFDVIFRSPGVYRYLPQIVEAEKSGTKVSSAVKLFFELCPAKIIAVTGTKGKGTTATLIYNILKKSGKRVFLAGNIGKPYLELLPKLQKGNWVVLELSSFQLIDLHKSPHIAVVLNITQDHLDWHKDLKEYIAAKRNIVKFQSAGDFAVINFDYATTREFDKSTKSKIFHFSLKKSVRGCYVDEGEFLLTVKGVQKIGKAGDLKLRGKHNWENVCASICASYLAGADISSIKKQVFSFKGLEHRLEEVGKVGKVAFYNDSFATGPQPTIAAIKSFEKPITVILGGFDKGFSYKNLAKEIVSHRAVICVVLIGAVAGKIKKELNATGFSGKILHLGKSSMTKIVRESFENTPVGGVVLLSPAAASFDMFRNYKERGEKFKKAVNRLKE